MLPFDDERKRGEHVGLERNHCDRNDVGAWTPWKSPEAQVRDWVVARFTPYITNQLPGAVEV
ncbi:MAG: hypothetical protein M3N93_00580 [Acidobacteriota bacterium]|nr:hypothetical protein [Acidobacteriota bacterium]